MALMLGVRLVSWGLAGAVVGITHQYTKDTEEKLYKWFGDKFWRRPPDPAAPSPNSGDYDPIPSTADQLQPLVHNIVDVNLTAELFETRPEERDLAHSVNAVSVDAARALQPTRPNAVNTVQGDLTAGHVNIDEVVLTHEAPASPAPPAVQGESAAEPTRSVLVNLHREAPDPAGILPAVQGESAAESPTSEVVNLCGESPDPRPATGIWAAGKLNWGVPEPDPPPATGFWATVKAWIAGKFNWGVPEPDPPTATGVWASIKAWIAGKLNWGAPEPDPNGRWVPGPGGRMLGPEKWEKIRRIQRKLLWLGVDLLLTSRFKPNSFLLQIYRIFKCELSQW